MSFIFCNVIRSVLSTSSSEHVISCCNRRYSVNTVRRKLAVLCVPGVAYIVRRKGRVDVIVGSGGRMIGDEVGDRRGGSCGDSPRRRVNEDISYNRSGRGGMDW